MMEVMGVFISWAKLPKKRSCRSTASSSWEMVPSSASAMVLKSRATRPISSSERTRTRLESRPEARSRDAPERLTRGFVSTWEMLYESRAHRPAVRRKTHR